MSAEIRAIFENMESRFKKGQLDREISYYFTLGKGVGEKWTVRVGPERCEVLEGKQADQADCVLKTTTKYFLKLIRDGHTPTPMDFMRGKIKSNDPMLLKELMTVFSF